MKRILFLLIVTLATAFVAYSQKLSKEDDSLYQLALEYSDNGNANKAIEIYGKLLEKYPDNSVLQYELAYCHYVKQDFKKAAKILEKAEKGDGAMGIMYAIHGNCLDMMGKQEKAIAKYKEGIDKFPDFGQLYLELGTVYRSRNDNNAAVEAYTKGIQVDPYYASNYYRLSQLLCMSSEPVYGIIYGEIHQLLSPNSRRSEELSKAIYDAYNANMKIDNDSTYRVSLTRKDQVEMTEDGKMEVPFEILYEAYIASRLENINTIRQKGHMDMMSLVETRLLFLTSCFADGANHKYILPIFKYQQMVLNAGHWEAYNMWLLRMGNEEEFSSWIADNVDKFNAFADWYRDHNFDPVKVVE